MDDARFIPFGLSSDDLEFVEHDTEEHNAFVEWRLKKMHRSVDSCASCLCLSLLRRATPIDHLIRPLHFDVFQLLSLPLHLEPDAIISHAFESKKSKRTGLAVPASAAHAADLHVCDLAPANLSVPVLKFLLNELHTRMRLAEDSTSDPLITAKYQPTNFGDSDIPPVNTAELMNPYELTSAMMPMWPAIGKHGHTLVSHLIATSDEKDESVTDFVPKASCVECLSFIIQLCQFLLEHAADERDDAVVMTSALAAFVQDFSEDAMADESYQTIKKKGAEGSLLHSCQLLFYLLRRIGIVMAELDTAVQVLQVMELMLKRVHSEEVRHTQTMACCMVDDASSRRRLMCACW
jgi:hypothetical protein